MRPLCLFQFGLCLQLHTNEFITRYCPISTSTTAGPYRQGERQDVSLLDTHNTWKQESTMCWRREKQRSHPSRVLCRLFDIVIDPINDCPLHILMPSCVETLKQQSITNRSVNTYTQQHKIIRHRTHTNTAAATKPSTTNPYTRTPMYTAAATKMTDEFMHTQTEQ